MLQFAVGVDVRVDPALDEIEIRRIPSALVDEVFAVEKESALVRPWANVRWILIGTCDGLDSCD